ncbi:MAG: carbohydrate ABC transporter substrate-binding protein, partial [Mesorhizobium sp.]
MSRNDQVHAFWNNLAQDFEAAHPGYRVEITHQPDYEYKERLLSMLGSPTPPDIMHTWGGGHLEALRVAGFARDLTKEMSDGWAMEFRPGVLQSFTQDGRIYGVPSSVELVSLWTNKALLEKAGVKREQLATWDGFLRA